MKQYRYWLGVILIITLISVWIDLPNNPGIHIDFDGNGDDDISLDFKVVQGLDLQGGSRVLLKSAVNEGIGEDQMRVARDIIENRVNGLGLSEAVVQVQGGNRIIVELPGVSDRELALQAVQDTGLLEFVDFANLAYLPVEGDCIITTEQLRIQQARELAAAEEEAGRNQVTPVAPTETPSSNPRVFGKVASPNTPAQPRQEEINEKCRNGFPVGQDGTSSGQAFPTVMTGSGLDDAAAVIDGTNQWLVSFVLNDEGNQIFGNHTASNIGQPLAIVLDGVVISSPVIQARITGTGTITGSFTRDEARSLAVQLKYGALPVPLEVDAYDQIGPTLGQISVDRSIQAGVIGVAVVLLFLLIYYRVPGIAAALALLVFSAINFALYKTIPVTLTLPSITGFLISIGTAVDGNILIFERLKEELRAGKSVEKAVELGFSRAWTSIRDSNLSTALICFILYIFGNTFGASAVQGFAITLAFGLLINIFTAIIVTRTLLATLLSILGDRVSRNKRLMGV